MQFPKPYTIRDKNYLKYIREQPCVVTRRNGVVAHHLESGMVGSKGDDWITVPLTPEMHQELHQVGWLSFEAKHNVNLWKCCAKLMVEYFKESDVYTPMG